MKLSSIVKKVTRFIDSVRQAATRPAQPVQVKPVKDEFQAAKPPLVDLGKAPAASRGSDGEYVKGLYRDLLGREPDPDGMASHMRGLETGMSRDEIRQVFLTSPEFRQKLAAVAGGAAPVSSTGLGAAAAAGRLGPVPLEGYDPVKLNNPAHQTVKYLFGRVASHFPLSSVKDMASAQALLEKMKPELEAAGLKIHGIKNDRIVVETELGRESVDVIRGAGSGNPGWWWGSEGKAIAGTGPTGPVSPGPGGALSTVPNRAEYATAPIDRSSVPAAAKSAAEWVKQHHPEFFDKGDDRQVAYEMMGWVIGALRAAGFDAHRVVNHPSRQVGDGMRYGSDAVVIDGRIFDVYGAWGDVGASTPQALEQGPYGAGRLRE